MIRKLSEKSKNSKDFSVSAYYSAVYYGEDLVAYYNPNIIDASDVHKLTPHLSRDESIYTLTLDILGIERIDETNYTHRGQLIKLKYNLEHDLSLEEFIDKYNLHQLVYEAFIHS